MNKRCFCPPESFEKGAFALVFQAQLCQQFFPVGRSRIERGIQVQRFPNAHPSGRLDCCSCIPVRSRRVLAIALRVRRQDAHRSGSPVYARPSQHSMVVVLPAPFGPTIPKISPSRTSNETSSTATVAP